jgi:MFS family permease
MLAGLSAAQVVSWGVLYYSFAVFVEPIERETGWSRTQVMGAFSLALLLSGAAAVPVGHWIDRRGTRLLMTAGTALAVAALALFSTVRSPAALYATWAALGLAMAATLYEPAFALLSRWFTRRRDRALSILTVCGGLASTLLVPLAAWLVATRGWRQAAMDLALLLACTALPVHALLLRSSPEAVGQHPDGDAAPPAPSRPPGHGASVGSAIRDARFLTLALAFTAASLVAVATTAHVVPYLIGRGASAAGAAGALALTGLMQLPGRIAFEPLRRRLSSRTLLAVSLSVQAAGLLALMAGPGRGAVVTFACLFGAGAGLSTLLRASLLADLYGVESYGRIGGLVALFTTFGRAGGPVLAALALAASGSYGVVLAGLVLLLVAATVVSLWPAPPMTTPAAA